MNSYETTKMYDELKEAVNEILVRLFTPAGLIQASGNQLTFLSEEIQAKIKLGNSQFSKGDFSQAHSTFNDLITKLESQQSLLKRIVIWNAAASAAAATEYTKAIELLTPGYLSNKLYGIPLWNLAVSLYREGRVGEALEAVKMYVARDVDKNNLRLARGELICSCLSLLLGNVANAKHHLQLACQLDIDFVSSQLEKHTTLPKTPLKQKKDEKKSQLSEDVFKQLIELTAPKRPTIEPEVSLYLSTGEREKFSRAIANIAEGELEIALEEIKIIREVRPNIPSIEAAVGSVYLLLGKLDLAMSIFWGIERSGAQMKGATLWNMACAQIRLEDFKGALQTLNKCAITEYKTKPQLWSAVHILNTNSPISIATHTKEKGIAQEAQAHPLTVNLPSDVYQRRIEVLDRILKPRNIPKAYRPDLGRLSQRDRQSIVSVLDSAHRLEAREAAKLLLPLVDRFADIYTLKAHAASFLVTAGDLQQARDIYLSAEKLQPIDSVSRTNLAYIYLKEKNISQVRFILEQGISTSISDDSFFWLALAISSELTNKKDVGLAAGRAVASGGPKAKIARDVLKLVSISASPTSTDKQNASPIILAVRKAIGYLDKDDLSATLIEIENIKPDILDVPEIGARVNEPELYETPYKSWDSTITRSFRESIKYYRQGDYKNAALGFLPLYSYGRRKAVAINLSAAFIMSGEPVKARRFAWFQRFRLDDPYSWRLIYNRALAMQKIGETKEAIKLIQQFKRANLRRFLPLLVYLSYLENENEYAQFIFSEALNELRKSVFTPSEGLVINLCWAILRQSSPDKKLVRDLFFGIMQSAQKTLESPTQVNSMAIVRNAYEQFKIEQEYNEAVAYMRAIIEFRSQQRQSEASIELSSRDLEHGFGVEFSARTCLIKALGYLGNREQIFRELDEAEALLRQYAANLAPGFLTADWHALAQAARETGLMWASLRYCEDGLTVEQDNKYLLELKSQLSVNASDEKSALLSGICVKIVSDLHSGNYELKPSISDLVNDAPSFYRVISELFGRLQNQEEIIDIEDLCDRISITSRFELPDFAYKTIDELVLWLVRTLGGNEARLQLEIEVYDDRIWPRIDDDREGCCLLTITARKDIQNISLDDPFSERRIWNGSLKAGVVEYVRWVLYKEDGFPAGSIIELPINIHINDSEKIDSRTSVVVTVSSSGDIVWPEYPTGALSPEDIPGQDLYGRLALIRKIIRGLGQKRSQATFFLQAPRQMGKTSLLNFVKKQTPDHVLPIYVNLEKDWSKIDKGNLWNYLVKRLREEAYGKIISEADQNLGESDLIMAVASICGELHKSYVLFLLDEFHFLFERADDPRSILASFRDYLNIQENKIGIIISDRYTRNELEKRCPSEYWDQLSVENVGPLDFDSTKQAIEHPTRSTDVYFLSETIEHLYRVTGGYPYHVQRLAQEIRDIMFVGPWVTALPNDVNVAIPDILEQDSLFTSGLCRPERIDGQLFEAIAALLEWKDLCSFIPELVIESKDASVLDGWEPDPRSFLSQFKDTATIFGRLKDIGVLRYDEKDFFSPLLEQWLRKMRRAGNSISLDTDNTHWQVISNTDGSALSARDWQNLDGELVRRTQYHGKSPLREKSSRADDWDTLVKETGSEHDFTSFLDAVFRLFIDDRDEKDAMQQYPWLYLSYHRIRLIRNYVIHRKRNRSALLAWNALCTRALGEERSAYWPTATSEWRALQVTILRILYMGIANAIELTGQRELGK